MKAKTTKTYFASLYQVVRIVLINNLLSFKYWLLLKHFLCKRFQYGLVWLVFLLITGSKTNYGLSVNHSTEP